MPDPTELLTTNRKALTINLDDAKYGTFAEIGAGQEVARIFFQAGGASRTIAKTISAYDMVFSDSIYGKAPRYVSRERLSLMLDHEYALLLERLAGSRGDRTTFFAFADTVATKSFKGNNDAHGWLGVRFQTEPHGPPSEIFIHVHMWDKASVLQQEALGVIGVNLIYGAFYHRTAPHAFITSLVDRLGAERIEIDMLQFSGPAFPPVDQRLLALHLVRTGLTNAVMFGPRGDVLQPSEVLRRKPVLVERGGFRPVTHAQIDLLRCATAQFMAEPLVAGQEVVVLAELTMSTLAASGALDPVDCLARVDLLAGLGYTVLISNYAEFFRLTSYFRRYTKEMIGVALGLRSLLEIFNEQHYEHLEGGLLESFGRMFRHAVKLYVYPMLPGAYAAYLASGRASAAAAGWPASQPADALVTAENLPLAPHLHHLYAHLLQNRYLTCLAGFSPAALAVFPRDVLRQIAAGDAAWELALPAATADAIKRQRLFGYSPPPAPARTSS